MEYLQIKSKIFKYKKYLDDPKVLLPLLFSGIFIFSVLLFLESFGSQAGGEKETIGYALYISNSVKRKGNSSVIWDNVKYEMPLSRFDTVRTDSEAASLISLLDGTELRLDENSMVMLDIKDKKQIIELLKGNFKFNKKSEASDLQIRSGDLKVNIGKIGEYNFKVHKNGKVDISVNIGEAKVNQKSLVYELKEAFLGFFGGGNKSETTSPVLETTSKTKDIVPNNPQNSDQNSPIEQPKIVESYSTLKFPENLKFFLTQSESLTIAFSWSAKEEVNRIQFSLKDNFSTIFKEFLTKDKELNLTLPIGSYYWRVISANPNSKVDTEIRKFIILKDNEFHLRFPNKDAIFILKEKSVLVNFAWDNIKDILKYKIEISKSINFEKLEYTAESQSNILSLEFNETGDFFYRIRAIQKNSDFPEKLTEIGKYSINKEEYTNSLELLNPPKFQKIEANNKLLFGWEDNKTFKKYTLLISENKEFTTNVKKISTTNNYTIEEKFQIEKDYFWKVEGLKVNDEIVSSEVRMITSKTNNSPPKKEETPITQKPIDPPAETPTPSLPTKTPTRLNAPKSKVNTEVKYEED